MRCGHGWEQAYDIEHHVDAAGRNFVVYKTEGLRVPSPLSSPSCGNCGGGVLRIMRSGQVSSVRELAMPQYGLSKAERSGRVALAESFPAVPLSAGDLPADSMSAGSTPAARQAHPWQHLLDLVHGLHHRK
jgi:hypothetical protein